MQSQSPNYSAGGSGLVGVGIGPRVIATLVDIGVFIGIGIMGFIISSISDTLGNVFGCFVAIVAIGYYVYMEKVYGGTVGKLVTGLRVVSENGGPIDWGQSVVRTLLRIVDGLPFFYIVAMIVISSSPLHQRVGDKVAKTLVVRKEQVNIQPPGAGNVRF